MARHADTEALLDRHGVTWEYVDALRLDKVDRPASAKEQYRIVEFHPDVAARYAATMVDQGGWGDFPPLILRRTGPGGRRLVLVSGMHRDRAAHQAGLTAAPAYLIRCPPKVGLLIALDDNAKHGQPLGNSERGALGARLVAEHGISQTEAAEVVGVSVSTVNRAVLVATTHRRADELKVDLAGLGFMVIEELGRIDDAKVFRRAAEVAQSIGSQTGKGFVARVRRALDDEDAKAALEVVAEREAMVRSRHRGGRGVRVPDADRLTDLCWALGDIDPDQVAEAATDPVAWHDRLRTAAKRLMAVDDAIRRKSAA